MTPQIKNDDITAQLRTYAAASIQQVRGIDLSELLRKAADEIDLWRERWQAEDEAFKQVHAELAKHDPVF